MICGITVPQDTTPLEIASAGVPWWKCQNGDLISWADPWVISILLQLPEARLHSVYSKANTLMGPKWKRSLSSEGFILDLGRAKLTFNSSTEQAFQDPTLSRFYLAPVYGRQIDLTVTHPVAGSLTKSTFISTSDSAGNTNCWVMLDLKYNPVTATLSVYGNGQFIMNAPISTQNAGELVLNNFDFKPTTISDPLGELILTSSWPNDGVTTPHYTIKHRQAAGYPQGFVGVSPTVGYIEFHRGLTDLPTHTETLDNTVCAYIGAPQLTLTGTSAELPQVTTLRNVSVTIKAQSDSSDNGICEVWWDANIGSKLLGKTNMVSGKFTLEVLSTVAGYGLLRIVNTTFNMGAGAMYLIKNPLPLIVS